MGGLFGGDAAAKAQAEASAKAEGMQQKQFEQYEKALEYYEGIGVPTEEAQRISLEAAQLDPSALEDIQIDPRLREAQMGALDEMQRIGKGELSAEEQAQQMMITRGAGAQAQAQDKTILQEMAQRGVSGGGSELAQRLQASQSAADRASVQQAQLAGQTQNRALQAIAQAGQLGGQIRGQEFGEQAQAATAADRIAQFNAMQRSQAQQQQEIHNKALAEKGFQQQLQLAGSKAGVRAGLGSQYGQAAGQALQAGQAKAQGALSGGAAKGKLFGTLAGAGIGFAAGGPAGAKLGTTIGSQATGADGGIMGYEDGGAVMVPNNNGGFAGGGMPIADSGREYEEGDVVPGDDFEGDRVDAKVNSGEMVINVEQQQRLMELLRGLRDLKGLGSEDIVEPEMDANMAVEQSLPAPEMAPEEGMDPAMMQALMAAQNGAPAPQMEDGGMVPSDFQTPSEAKPRGLHASLKYEKEQEQETKDKEKQRKARIKAYETLLNGGK